MNLFDPNRPQLPNGKAAWYRGNIAIPNLELRPLPSGDLELSLFLPLFSTGFVSKRYIKTLSLPDFLLFLKDFILDPETTCEILFNFEPNDLKPELRKAPTPKQIPIPVPVSKEITLINDEL